MAVIMGFLVISFAIWGIGDIFRGFGRNEVAKVGGTEISVEEFRQYYNDRLQQLGRQLRRSISPDQSRALGLDRQILGQIIAETALDQKAKKLRLGLSNEAIASQIMGDPSFHGPSGQFDRARFEQMINQAGFTEDRYVADQRNVMIRRQIAQSVSDGLTAPKTALRAIQQFRDEKRDVSYLALGPDQAGTIPAPTPEQFSKYFDEHKTMFRAPEYRKLVVLSVTPAALAKPDAVSDADAKTYYEQHKGQFGTPEKREVRQIVFAKPEDAAAAREQIAKGKTFDDIAKARNLKSSDTDLGLVAKSALIDTAAAEAAFSLKSGEVSQPVKGRFGSVLVTVGKIVPGVQKSFDDVAPQIKREIAESRARSQLGDLRDKIEDEKASGATLAEAAKKLGLNVMTIDAVDRSGRDSSGKSVTSLPKNPDVISAAFASDVGVDNEALQLPGGGYLYFDVVGVNPSRARTLDEVKDQVTARWRGDEIANRLKAKADAMVAKLKSSGSLDQAASEAGVPMQKATAVQRNKSNGFASAKLVEAAFRTPKGVVGSVEGDKETERYVFVVTAVNDPALDPNSPEAKAIATQLDRAYTDEFLGAYVTQIESELGVSINQSALQQVVGGGPGG